MTTDASFLPPHIVPPDPPEAKIVALVFSVVMSALMILFAGFVGIEFFFDMLGRPLYFAAQQPILDVPMLTEPSTADESKSPAELITPKNMTQRRGADVVVLYTIRSPELLSSQVPPDFTINNVRYPWDVQYGSNTWFARVHLPDGRHHLCVADTEIEFYTTQEEEDKTLINEALYRRHRFHPDTDKPNRCSDCHEMSRQFFEPSVTGRGSSIGAWKGIASCFDCHEEEKHDSIHAALLPISNQCLRCHSTH